MDVVVGNQTENSITTTTLEESVGGVDWLELPEHITALILSKLSSIIDYVRFGVVCVPWRSIRLNYTTSLPPQLPLLIIPTPPTSSSSSSHNKKKKKYYKKKNKKNSDETISCSFYRVTDEKIFTRLKLAMPRNRYVRGSSHGWLITIDADDLIFSIQLINPFFYPNTSTKEIKLPPLTSHPCCENPDYLYYSHFRKAILSANPISNPKDFMVIAIITGYQTLSFYKPGDKTWTRITDEWKGMYTDIIYYQDKLYAVHFRGHVEVFDLVKHTTTPFAPCPVTDFLTFKIYLVESGGELFQVHRSLADDRNFDTDEFKVFKLQKREEVPEWVEVKGLCNRVFFVGNNASMSISVGDFPCCKPNCIYYTDDDIELFFVGNNASMSISVGDFPCCKPNCIYYTDDDIECYVADPEDGPHDMGVFNVENESFEKHYPTDVNVRIWPAPIWIEPVVLPRSTQCLKRLGVA